MPYYYIIAVYITVTCCGYGSRKGCIDGGAAVCCKVYSVMKAPLSRKWIPSPAVTGSYPVSSAYGRLKEVSVYFLKGYPVKFCIRQKDGSSCFY